MTKAWDSRAGVQRQPLHGRQHRQGVLQYRMHPLAEASVPEAVFKALHYAIHDAGTEIGGNEGC
jgi:hypothetical protein